MNVLIRVIAMLGIIWAVTSSLIEPDRIALVLLVVFMFFILDSRLDDLTTKSKHKHDPTTNNQREGKL